MNSRQFIRQTKQPVHLGFDGVHTQAELRKLAAEYIVQAIDIESKELGLLRSEEPSPLRTLGYGEGTSHDGLPRKDRPT